MTRWRSGSSISSSGSGGTSGNRASIGIIGAGTAGLAAAIAFARAGHAVTVLEKYPAVATRGNGLLIQPQGVAALAALGVADAFDAASLPIDHLLGLTQRRWKLVDIAYRRQPARAIGRAPLAQLLLAEALAQGAVLRYGAGVTRVASDGANGVAWIGDEAAAFDLLVIADGAASTLPAQAGLSAPAAPYRWGALWGMFDIDQWHAPRRLEQRYRGTEQMFGLMPTELVGTKLRMSLFWSLPCHSYAAWRAAPLEGWKTALLALWPEAGPVVAQITSHDQLTLASYRHARAVRLARPPVCCIGDAAHAMSPQLGLGSTLAVQDALLLAAMVAEHGIHDGPLAFSRRRLPAVRAYQALSRALTPCFQAAGTGLWRDLLFAGALYVPGTRALMYRGVAEPVALPAPPRG